MASNTPNENNALAPTTQESQDKAEIYALLQQLKMLPPDKKALPQSSDEFPFWKTQPVPKLQDASIVSTSEMGPIDAEKSVESVRKEAFKMPAGFSWCSVNMADKNERQEVYTLLNENYVEDDDNMFRFDYSVDFLQWALCSPGYISDWHVGVRRATDNALVAFISGIPVSINVHDSVQSMAEINFLCIHKKLRSKRLAPVLIKEITRRVNLKGIWQAVYTAGVFLPKPVGQCRYYHRSLNPKKLIEVGFSRLAPKRTMTQTVKMYKLPDDPSVKGLRIMTEADVPQVTVLLENYLKSYKLTPRMDEAEVAHWILPREGVINSYVVENDGVVTDFCSFYHLPSTVIGHDKHKDLRAAYSFYNVANSVTLIELMADCLVKARDAGFDVFNALNLMENQKMMEPLKFGIGDGELHYYLYNWKCPQIQPNEVGIVLC